MKGSSRKPIKASSFLFPEEEEEYRKVLADWPPLDGDDVLESSAVGGVDCAPVVVVVVVVVVVSEAAEL